MIKAGDEQGHPLRFRANNMQENPTRVSKRVVSRVCQLCTAYHVLTYTCSHDCPQESVQMGASSVTACLVSPRIAYGACQSLVA